MERWVIEQDEYMERMAAERAAAAMADLDAALTEAGEAWEREWRVGIQAGSVNMRDVRDVANAAYRATLRSGMRHWYPEA